MISDIIELSKSLDSVIEAGEKIENRAQELRKGLSFDPFRPIEMHEERTFYNPYQWMDNGYMPHKPEYWYDQGVDKEKNEYAEVHKLYAGINGTRSLYRALERGDLEKAGAVPVGTVHTYTNGVKYKKIAEGQWAPVRDSNKQMTGHEDIERHATSVNTVKDHIKQRSKEGAMTDQLKEEARREAMKQVKEAMKHIFGDELPDSLKQHFDKHDKETAAKDKEAKVTPEDKLAEMKNDIKGKKHDVHVHFTHNGKDYQHTFSGVMGHNTQEVSGRIGDMVKKKIPGAIINRIKTDIKEQAKTAKPNWN